MKKRLLYLLVLSVFCASLLSACTNDQPDANEAEPAATEEAVAPVEEKEEPVADEPVAEEPEEEKLNTLEEFLANNPDELTDFRAQLGPNEYHTDMYVEGNTIYTINEQSAQYQANGMSLEEVMSRQEQTTEALRNSLEGSHVAESCRAIKDTAGTEEIVWVYVFMYGDTEIASIPISSED